MSKSVRNFVGVLVVVAIMLAGCGESEDQARVRVLNASQDYDLLDLYVDGDRKATAVAYDTVSGYVRLDEDTYTLDFQRNGSESKLQSLSETLSKKSHKTYVAYGWAASRRRRSIRPACVMGCGDCVIRGLSSP